MYFCFNTFCDFSQTKGIFKYYQFLAKKKKSKRARLCKTLKEVYTNFIKKSKVLRRLIVLPGNIHCQLLYESFINGATETYCLWTITWVAITIIVLEMEKHTQKVNKCVSELTSMKSMNTFLNNGTSYYIVPTEFQCYVIPDNIYTKDPIWGSSVKIDLFNCYLSFLPPPPFYQSAK